MGLRLSRAAGIHHGRRVPWLARAGRRSPRLPRGVAAPLPRRQLPPRAHAQARRRHRRERRALRLGERRARRPRGVAGAPPRPRRRRLHRRRPRDHRRDAGLLQDHRDRRRARRGRPRGRLVLGAGEPRAADPGVHRRDYRHRRRDGRGRAADRGRAAAVRRLLGALGAGGAQRPVRPRVPRLRTGPAAPRDVPTAGARHAAPGAQALPAAALLPERPRVSVRHQSQAGPAPCRTRKRPPSCSSSSSPGCRSRA